MHSPRHNSVPDARSPIAASPSAESAPVPARTSEEPTRGPFCYRRSESLPTNKVQAHRHLFFEKPPCRPPSVPAVPHLLPVAPVPPELQRSCHKNPCRPKLLGRHRGLLAFPLPLSSDEDDEAMDFSNSQKRLREESGNEDDHAPRKQTAMTPSESSEEESHTSQGSEELSGSECKTTVDSEVASTTADMTSSATTGGMDPASSDGAGTDQLPTTASTDDLSTTGDPCPPSSHTEGLPLPATSPEGVESTLPACAAERDHRISRQPTP
ncbi:hypothetical protein MRX96_042182 [Rhipicephalus microplus]